MIQDWRDTGKEGYRKGGIPERRDKRKEDSGQEDSGHKGCEGYRKGVIKERRDSVQEMRAAGIEGFRG